MRRARAVAALVLMLLCLVAPAAQAAVPAVPAVPGVPDCLRPPTPASPTSGLSGWIDPGPEAPAQGDPFDPDSGATLYDVYGYAGFSPVVFAPGCFNAAQVWDVPNFFASSLISLAGVAIATTARATRITMDGQVGAMWDPLQEQAQRILGEGLFIPLIGVAVMVTAIYLAARGHRGELAEQSRATLAAAVIVMAGVAAAVYPLTVGAAVDRGLGQAFAAANSMATRTGQVEVDPADAVAGNLIHEVMWGAWVGATFGGDGPAAEKYGPALFAEGALTRGEQAEIDRDPSKADEIFDRKRAAYKEVAEKIEKEFPQAYQQLAGTDTMPRVGFAAAGLVGAVSAVGFLLVCLVRELLAMVIVRIGIGATPLIALLAQFPRLNRLAMQLLMWVAAAVKVAVAFGFAFAVFLAGGIGGIMSPDNGWHPLIKAGALILATVAVRQLMRKLGVLGGRQERRRRGEERGDRARSRAGRAQGDAAGDDPSKAPPVEAGQLPRRAPAAPQAPAARVAGGPQQRPQGAPARKVGGAVNSLAAAAQLLAKAKTATPTGAAVTVGSVVVRKGGAQVVSKVRARAAGSTRPPGRSGANPSTRRVLTVVSSTATPRKLYVPRDKPSIGKVGGRS